ncbi:MAG: HAD family hydrolase [Armatimonadota bacterium]
MLPFDLAVFDIAGTTVRDERFVALAFQTALAKHDHDVEMDRLDAVMGLAKPVAIGIVLDLDPESDEVLAVFETFREEMVRFYREDDRVEPIPGAENVFRFLQENSVKVALDTGFDREITDLILGRLGWDSTVIDASITSDEVKQGRPHPDMIHALMAELRIPSTRRVMKIGDTVSDIGEGRSAGCGLVIGVLSGTDNELALEGENPDLILNSVIEMLDLDFNVLAAQGSKPG